MFLLVVVDADASTQVVMGRFSGGILHWIRVCLCKSAAVTVGTCVAPNVVGMVVVLIVVLFVVAVADFIGGGGSSSNNKNLCNNNSNKPSKSTRCDTTRADRLRFSH